MEGTGIIWKFLTYEYPDEHQLIYSYTLNNPKTNGLVIEKMVKITRKVFGPAFNDEVLNTEIKAFLENKRNQYLRHEIKVKPIYP